MASDEVQNWQRRNRPSFRRRTAASSAGTFNRSGTINVIHPEVTQVDFMTRQRYYECANQQCCVEGMYAPVRNDVIDTASGREAWVQNAIEQQYKIVANIRSQPWPMAKKKQVLGLARQFIGDYEPDMGLLPSRQELSYPVSKSFRSWASYWKRIFWGERIRRITGMFGSGVASYFKLLRWLCVLNLTLTIFIFSFICIPQLIYHEEGLDPPSNYTYPISLVVDGKGVDFEYSILFIGYYTNGRSNGDSNELGMVYKLPIAYLVVMFWAFLISICFILVSMSEKHTILERVKIRDVFPFSWRVFATWDFSVTSKSGVITKHKVLLREFKELVDEHLSRGGKNKCVLILLRFLVTLMVLLIYIGSGVAIYFTVDWVTECPSIEKQEDVDDGYCYRANDVLQDSDNLREFVNFLLAFRLAIIVSLLNICLSWVMLAVVKVEFWTPRNENIVSILRIFVLYLFNLGVLTYSLYTLSQNCGADCCWETVIGQQIYRLVCFELFAEFVSVLIADILRGLIVRSRKIKALSDWIDYPIFNLPKNTVNLIYGQALVWLGMFFCPLLPFVSLLKDVILFYMRSWVVRVLNNAPRHLYRAEATINYYFALLLLLVVAIMFPVGWAVTRLSPSGVCGPFRGKEFMIDAIEDEIAGWESSSSDSLHRFGEFVQGLQTSAVVIPCFLILIIIAYYFYTRASSLKEIKKDLIIQLDVEKQKLHERITRDAMQQQARRSFAYEGNDRRSYAYEGSEHQSYLHNQDQLRSQSTPDQQTGVASPSHDELPNQHQLQQKSPPSSSGSGSKSTAAAIPRDYRPHEAMINDQMV